MNRRSFLASIAGAALPISGSAASGPDRAAARLACTSVSFRHRFAATRTKGQTAREPDLSLLDLPALFSERLGLRQVEVWSRHFPEPTLAFAGNLRRAAERVGSRIINLQQDEPPFELSHPDATRRAASVASIRHWMDLAAACGAPSLRANVGGRPTDPFDLSATADAFRRLADHGAKIGVKILVENHGGHSLKAENVAALVAAVDSPWCRSLPDFGNLPPGTSLPDRVAFLQRILPFAALISAKGMEFDADYRHTSYDVGACVRASEAAGFTGIYSIELWAPNYTPPDPFRAVLAMRDEISRHLRG
jgi:sugar phosphate isomerase/epimerase